MAKQRKKLFQKVFSVSLAESCQSPIPPCDFLVTSKSPLLKALASQLQFVRTEPKAKPREHVTRYGAVGSILSKTTPLVKLVHTPCFASSTPQNPQSHFQKRIRNGKRTVVKKQNVQEQRVLNQQNWSTEEFWRTFPQSVINFTLCDAVPLFTPRFILGWTLTPASTAAPSTQSVSNSSGTAFFCRFALTQNRSLLLLGVTCAEELVLEVSVPTGGHALPVLEEQGRPARLALKPIGAGGARFVAGCRERAREKGRRADPKCLHAARLPCSDKRR